MHLCGLFYRAWLVPGMQLVSLCRSKAGTIVPPAGSMPFCSSTGKRSSTGLVRLLQMQRLGTGWTPCGSKLLAHR